MKKMLMLLVLGLILNSKLICNCVYAEKSNINTIDWTSYLEKCEQQAKKNWKPVASAKSYSAIAHVLIGKQGEIRGLWMKKSSGNWLSDDSIKESIKKGEPYPALPVEYNKKYIPVELTFEYKISPSIKSQGIKPNDYNTVNWGPYMRNMEQKIKNNWIPPRDNVPKGTVVSLVINKEGKLLDAKIIKSSDVADYDKAAMSAIQKTIYEPLPPEFLGQSVPIEFTFDYNVLNSATIPVQHLEQCKTKFCKFLYSHQ